MGGLTTGSAGLSGSNTGLEAGTSGLKLGNGLEGIISDDPSPQGDNLLAETGAYLQAENGDYILTG